MKRRKMKRKYSEKNFTRGAMRVHPKNGYTTGPMRGGIRL